MARNVVIGNDFVEAPDRLSRSGFFWGWLLVFVVGILAIAVAAAAGSRGMMNFILFVGTGFQALLAVRRLHDIGTSGWWCLLLFVPVIGLVFLLYLFFTPSQPVPPAPVVNSLPITDEMRASFADQLMSTSIGKDGLLTPEAQDILIKAFEDGWRITTEGVKEKDIVLRKPGEHTRRWYFLSDIIYFGETHNYVTSAGHGAAEVTEPAAKTRS